MVVVPIRRPKPVYGRSLTNADEVMQIIRDELHEHDLHTLAEKMDVSYGCLVAIRSGRTKWPRPKTFFGLVEQLDLRLMLVKNNT